MWIKPKDVLPCNQSIVGRAAIGKTCHLNDYLPGCIRLKRFVIANLCFNQTTFYARFLHFYKAVVEVVFSPPLKTGFIREKKLPNRFDRNMFFTFTETPLFRRLLLLLSTSRDATFRTVANCKFFRLFNFLSLSFSFVLASFDDDDYFFALFG